MGHFSHRLWARARLVRGLVLLLVGGLALGCGRGSFVGRQYDDLTAYYNTFYNANQAFEDGLESVNESGGDVDRTRYISVFPVPQGGAGESSFEKAIQKSADVLREHPNSEWVDDALLLIGRARYYQRNYVGAAQKFREVIALGAERVEEARFRLVQTLLAAGRSSEAAEALRAGLETEAGAGPWTARMRLARGVLLVRQQEWQEAETALARGLTGPVPDEVGARGTFLLGQVRETQRRFAEAEEAYRRALEYDPDYRLAFAARLAAIEMAGLHGAPTRALERLATLERDDNTNEMRGQIARVRARLYLEQDRPRRARQVLTDLLRSESAPRGDVLGRVHYDLAALYRDRYEDFTRAAAHFDTAATNLSGEAGGETDNEGQALPRAPSDASAEAARFRGLADQAQAVARMDSLLRLGRMPPAEFRAAVEQIRQRQRLRREEGQAAPRRPRRDQFRSRRRTAGDPAAASSPRQNAVQTRGGDAGFLFHRDPTLVQQGRRQFEQTWGERPLVDDWRRVEAIRGREAPATAAKESAPQPDTESAAPSPPRTQGVDVSAVPRDSASRAKMEAERAVARYELANALFRAAGRPDSAQTWFRRILEEDADQPVARRALYGLAQTHRAQGDTAAARTAYRRLIEQYPGTPHAARAREQLGLESADTSPTAAGSEADSAYARAYATWQDGSHADALVAFLRVADTYRETRVAPRALLAAGVVYHRSAPRDSSGRLAAKFERYVDSLAQSPPTAEALTGTSKGGQRAGGDPPSSPPDSASGNDGSPTPADSTHGAVRPRRVVQAPDTVEQESRGPSDPGADTSTAALRRVAQAPDSAAARPVAQRDTVAPTSRSPAPDTTTADTTRARPAADSAGTDSPSQTSASRPFEVLLTHLTEAYPDTPEAERARTLLSHLRARRAATVSDSADTDTRERGDERSTAAPTEGPGTSASRAVGASAGTPVRSRSPRTDTTQSDPAPSDAPSPRQRRDTTATPIRDSTAVPSDSSSISKTPPPDQDN